ncbi:MAG: HAD-IA family hydrolase [Pseudomonadota bacterium]
MDCKIIAWDFDGVLNRNIVDGNFLWKATFDEDMGGSVSDFSQYMFRSGRFGDVLAGQRDIRDLVADWLNQSSCQKTPDEILEYWFRKDALPDARTIDILTRARAAGYRNVIATNNEARRAAYIERDMGFGAHVEHVFAAGPMQCQKPEPAFYQTIERTLGVSGSDLFLIDDKAENVTAARALGWDGFFFREGDYAGLEEALFG